MPHDKTWDLKLYAVLGAVFVLLVAGAAIVLIVLGTHKPLAPAAGKSSQSASKVTGKLGEISSTCGGPQRLPCRPGLKCSNGDDTQSYGTCVKVVIPSTEGVLAQGQLNEGCNELNACVPGLYCKQGICASLESMAPRIQEMLLDGAQLNYGGYMAKPGTTITLNLQTLNAENVTIYYLSADGSQTKKVEPVAKSAGGKYSADFSIVKGMQGWLEARATAQSGDYSVLSVGIAASE